MTVVDDDLTFDCLQFFARCVSHLCRRVCEHGASGKWKKPDGSCIFWTLQTQRLAIRSAEHEMQ